MKNSISKITATFPYKSGYFFERINNMNITIVKYKIISFKNLTPFTLIPNITYILIGITLS
jgi:hypothetical protein